MTGHQKILVQQAAFCLEVETKQLVGTNQDIGAIVTFTGCVRGFVKDKTGAAQKLLSMELEHYPGMTEKELEAIATKADARWPLQGVTIIHRYGVLKPADPIVLVLTASSHRQAAFEAGEFIMDFLKTKATFWKKETLEDGTGTWVDAKDSDEQVLARWTKA